MRSVLLCFRGGVYGQLEQQHAVLSLSTPMPASVRTCVRQRQRHLRQRVSAAEGGVRAPEANQSQAARCLW